MIPFRDLPIRSKLLRMTLFPTAAALVLASVGFLTWDVNQLRNEIVEDVNAQSRIISEAVAPSMEFDRPEVAQETLANLTLRPRVRFACLYSANGTLFATYQRSTNAGCPADAPAVTTMGWQNFDALTEVKSQNDIVGTLYIARDLGDVAVRLRVGAATVLGLLLVSIATASLIARGMQRSIAAPLLALADTARLISSTPDSELRAVPVSKDETGTVVQAFNDMLDRIATRTAALSRANAELEREIEERERVERERIAALDRERDANRLKDEFLATLSHELRTPLNAVLGWTRVLRSAQVEPTTSQRALESIERNARMQVRLIEDLLEISRIVTGKLRLQLRETDLAAIVDAAVEVVQPAAAAKRLQLHVDVGVRPAPTAADPDRLQQVVWNLLSNAVKFTPAGGSVSIRLVRDGGYRVTVQDTGLGIDTRFLPFVFEAFRQADGTASREHGGLGLGLAIAKQLVELHGGTIEASSDGRNRGARFDVCLPSVGAPPVAGTGRSPAVDARPAEPVDRTLLRNVRVLVVDDEVDAREVMEATLAQYGAEVTTAQSASEALAVIELAQPHVIVSDIGMPNEDGFVLMRRLRARPAAQGGAVPAIAVTAYVSANDRSATEAAGYQAHIAKPFEPGEVARLVAELANASTRSS